MTDGQQLEKRDAQPRSIEQVFASESFKQQVAAALPAHIKPDTMMRIALTEVRLNPDLLKCTPASFMGALLKASQAGLRPGMFGECWLLPRWNGKTQSLEAQFQSGYQGLVQLAYRSSEVTQVLAEAVYVGDHFRYELGSEPRIEHSPALDAIHDWEHVVAFYAVICLKNGGKLIKVMSRQQVEEHRDRFAPRNKAKQIVGPWTSDPIPMGCKTVLLQVLKFAPKETERLAIAMADNDVLFNDRVADAVVETGTAQNRVHARLGLDEEAQPQPEDESSSEQAEEVDWTEVESESDESEAEAEPLASQHDQTTIKREAKKAGVDVGAELRERYGVETSAELTQTQAKSYVESLRKRSNGGGQIDMGAN